MPKRTIVIGTLVFLLSGCCGCGLASYVPWAPDFIERDGGSTNGTNGGSTNGGTTDNGRNNNGFGNGDQDAPGNSANHNRAENDRSSRSDPSHKGK